MQMQKAKTLKAPEFLLGGHFLYIQIAKINISFLSVD